MKVTDGGIIDLVNEEEKDFYAMLKQVLEKIFEVDVTALPTILKTLGIKVPVGVEEYCYYVTHDAKMKFETGETVIFHGGHMLDPYPYITCNQDTFILIPKDRKVLKLANLKDDFEE